ncbi:cytochrome c [Roseomonas sp. NAR14]|uniref:Cytochrome c n=1 Tax=Roseomonas acroporae TaxID=2937791 RepID=A0A9X1YFU3_9PROT|nr:cytochrome c [Roseomonas acroporae]MCK8788108.1 cytochrome c [Roseomonas acroporae]
MRRRLAPLLAAVLLATAGLGTRPAATPGGARAIPAATPNTGSATESAAPPAADPALVARGAYLARLGDCTACHTAPGGRPFAGGLAMATPVGTIYSTNITPDRETGIGRYSEADFARVLREGVVPEGHTLYPAMPYPSYARLTEADTAALYAYFMHGVAPQRQANRDSDIPWPLSMRWPLRFWRLAFAPAPRPFDAAAYPDPRVARGAYLVQGLGHCGACHTPRALTMQEKALTDRDGADYLAGGAVIDGWVAPALRNDARAGLASWSEQDIVEFLRTGRNRFTAVFGGMTDVVAHSTQHMTEADLGAIAAYLKSLGGAPRDPYRPDGATEAALRGGDDGARGAAVYLDNCNACHRSGGQGYTRVFPALAGNPVVLDADPTSLIRIVLFGSTLPGLRTAPSAFTMPPAAGRLDDAAVADVASFVRAAWGNRGTPVAASDVAAVRRTATPAERARAREAAPAPR